MQSSVKKEGSEQSSVRQTIVFSVRDWTGVDCVVCVQGVLQFLSCSGGHYTCRTGELPVIVPLYMYNIPHSVYIQGAKGVLPEPFSASLSLSTGHYLRTNGCLVLF